MKRALAAGLIQPPGLLRRAIPDWVWGVGLGLGLWQVLAVSLAGSYVLVGPWEVAQYCASHSGLLSRALAITLWEAAWGFLWGNLAAVALAMICVLAPRAERILAGLALAMFCLPLVATGPLLRVFYGPGLGPQITLAALAVYYTTFITFLVGLRAAPSVWFDLVRSYGHGGLAELWLIRLRAAMPYLIAGLQISAPAAILGAMIGEFTGAERGMGVLAIRAMRSLDIPATWSLALLAAAVSILVYAGLGRLRGVLYPDTPALLLNSPAPQPSQHLAKPAWRLAEAFVITSLILLIWHWSLETLELSRYFAKRPGDVWAYLVTDPQSATHRQILLTALGQTLVYVLPGYVLGLGLGAGLAALVMVWPKTALLAMPLAVTLRSVPIVTTAPLIVLALGRGALGTITIVAVMIFFPSFVACLQGMRQTPGQVMDVFASYAAGRRQRLIYAHLPAMLPALFASARMAVPAAMLAGTVAEWLATGTGLGTLMAVSASTSGYGMLWSAVVITTLTASLAYRGVEAIEGLVLRRYAPEQLR
ncbi:MAG: ABC transporter permease [Mangrovicoccus sp.]